MICLIISQPLIQTVSHLFPHNVLQLSNKYLSNITIYYINFTWHQYRSTAILTNLSEKNS